MAAPTVGAIMADILPYLGVPRNYTPEELPGQQISVPDLTGLSKKEAEKSLKELGLLAAFRGEGPQVLGQIPAAGQTLPGESQVLVYLESPEEPGTVTVPDFLGKNKAQAAALAGPLGLYILPTGNPEADGAVTVIAQEPEPGAPAERGSTVTLRFADKTAKD